MLFKLMFYYDFITIIYIKTIVKTQLFLKITFYTVK